MSSASEKMKTEVFCTSWFLSIGKHGRMELQEKNKTGETNLYSSVKSTNGFMYQTSGGNSGFPE
jgi:hypothetical protein